MLRRLGTFFLDILQVIVFAVAIFLFIYLLILQPHKIKGNSMHPNFQNGEFLLTDKVTYRFNEPQRGDVVVFKAPPDDKEEFIKRVIGLPGEEVKVAGGKIYINNNLLPEPYIDSSIQTQSGNFLVEGKNAIVPEGTYILIGDNRDHSFDSRNFGPIKKLKITGRAWIIYWPVNKAGLIEGPTYGF